MKPDWTPLDTELQAWSAAGLELPLWWRDDDAVAPSSHLDNLAELSRRVGLPVHLAVIPQDAGPDLAALVAETPEMIPVVHGWAHCNHAPPGEKKSEFRLHRPLDAISADARRGLHKLRSLFGARLRPMFVPPWNRIAPEVSMTLPDMGFCVLSTATPRNRRFVTPGLTAVNTHLDPIDWRGGRGLVDPEMLISQVATLLRDRREGRSDADEPFGVLTHHLVHDQQIWDFTEILLTKLLTGPVRVWTAPRASNDQGRPR